MTNRQITVGIAKKEPLERDGSVISFEDKVMIVDTAVNRSIRKIIIGVCAYVALDTIRKVIVNKTS
jgi:hypothetical protein